MPAESRQRHLRGVESNENEVAAQTRERRGHELAAVDSALDQILQGFDALANLKAGPDSRLEEAQVILAVRSFNSLHTARQVLEQGYYQQASTLVRMAMEDQLVSEDAERHPPTLDALLDGKGSINSGDLTFGKMAERISPEARETWDLNYGNLSERAAHPRRKSLMALVTARGTLPPGGNYDEVGVNAVLFYLLDQLQMVLRTVGVLTESAGSPWLEGAAPVFNDVIALHRQIDEWARQQLEME